MEMITLKSDGEKKLCRDFVSPPVDVVFFGSQDFIQIFWFFEPWDREIFLTNPGERIDDIFCSNTQFLLSRRLKKGFFLQDGPRAHRYKYGGVIIPS